MASQIRARKRITIYADQRERQELLDWTRNFTRASSTSEAIFQALEMLRSQTQKSKKKKGAEALAKTKGIWANDPKLEEVFEKISEGWNDWSDEPSS